MVDEYVFWWFDDVLWSTIQGLQWFLVVNIWRTVNQWLLAMVNKGADNGSWWSVLWDGPLWEGWYWYGSIPNRAKDEGVNIHTARRKWWVCLAVFLWEIQKSHMPPPGAGTTGTTQTICDKHIALFPLCTYHGYMWTWVEMLAIAGYWTILHGWSLIAWYNYHCWSSSMGHRDYHYLPRDWKW